MRRKLVLIFDIVADAQSFIMCMELLVRFSQEEAPFQQPNSPPREDNSSRSAQKQFPQSRWNLEAHAQAHRLRSALPVPMQDGPLMRTEGIFNAMQPMKKSGHVGEC